MDTLVTVSGWIVALAFVYVVSVVLLCLVILRLWDDMPFSLLQAIGLYCLPVVLWVPGLRDVVNGVMKRQQQRRERQQQIEFYGRELTQEEIDSMRGRR